MKIPLSDASVAARRLVQAQKIAILLVERKADIESTFMADLIRTMSRSLVAIGFGADFIAEEARILRALVKKEMASGADGQLSLLLVPADNFGGSAYQ